MEHKSIWLMRARANRQPLVTQTIEKIVVGTYQEGESEFLHSYKKLYNMVYSGIENINFTTKEKEDLIVDGIELLAKGLDISNNSNSTNRRTFITFKMHKLIVYILNLYAVPKWGTSFIGLIDQSISRIIISCLNWLEKLWRVENEDQFHSEIAYYDPLIVCLFRCLSTVEPHFK